MPGAPHPARPESPGAQQSHDGEARVGSCKLLLPEQWTFFVRVGADGGEVTVARWLTPCVYSVDRDKRSAGLYLKDTFHTTLHWSTSKLIVILVLMYARVCLVQERLVKSCALTWCTHTHTQVLHLFRGLHAAVQGHRQPLQHRFQDVDEHVLL